MYITIVRFMVDLKNIMTIKAYLDDTYLYEQDAIISAKG